MNECRARCLSLFSVDLNQLPLWILLSHLTSPPFSAMTRQFAAWNFYYR
jgi:hypothetical protein